MNITTQPQPTTGRDSNGRFAKGNAGGPGNPYTREVAALKKMMLQRMDAGKLAALVDQMYLAAMNGNVPAARLIFSYTLGKPTDVDPDRVDIEEWNLMKEEAAMTKEMPEMINKPEPGFPLQMVRAARPGVTTGMAPQFEARMIIVKRARTLPLVILYTCTLPL